MFIIGLFKNSQLFVFRILMSMLAEPAERPHLFLGNDQLAWFSLLNKHFHFWTNIFTFEQTFSLPRIPPRQVSESSGGRPPRLQVNPAVQERQEQVKVTVNCNCKNNSSSKLLLADPTNSLGLLFQIFSISYFCQVDRIVWILLFSCSSSSCVLLFRKYRGSPGRGRMIWRSISK